MDANSFNVNVLKEKPRIVNLLNMKGPLVAPFIAKQLSLNSFLASALLSELLHDQQIKTSALRVGGGPLYYIPGQEGMVENFVQYLPSKEREAFALLKREEILEDSKQDPAIRVALRSIKDFAVPLKVHTDSEVKTFWKIHLMAKEEFEKRMSTLLNPKKEEKPEEKKEEIKQEARQETKQEIEEKKEEKPAEKKIKRKERKPKSFESSVDEWMKENNISAINLTKDAKTCQGRVNVPEKGEHMLIARNKRTLTEIDLIVASQIGLNEKLPVILLANGKLTKKAEEISGLFKCLDFQRL